MQNKKIIELVIFLPIFMSLGIFFLVLWLLKGPSFLPLAKNLLKAMAFSGLVAVLWVKYLEQQKISMKYVALGFAAFTFTVLL